MSKALVVLSGGQDSTTCVFWAKQRFDEVHAVTFDYNQRHRCEIEAAKIVGKIAGVASHQVVELGAVLKGRSFLTDPDAEVEQFDSFDTMNHHNAFKENKLDSSFVPMRNPLFLTIAANRAFVVGASSLVTGVTAADFAEFGEFSWQWLGGFVDAEGCFGKTNVSSYSLGIWQKDPEVMLRLGQWIVSQVPGVTFGFSISRDSVAELSISKRSFQLISHLLTPHLHSDYRRRQAEKSGIKLKQEAPINDAYVVGFWEGDGSCYSSYVPAGDGYITRSFLFTFYQRSPQILERIKDYLGAGYIGPHHEIWSLSVSDGPKRGKLLERFRPHFCVLGTFRKITKYRHKIDLMAGGFNPPYPDCTPDFIFTFQKVLDESLKQPGVERIVIETPLMFLSKAQSIQLARSLPQCYESLAFSHTSYEGTYPPIGHDHATLLRAKGFEEAGVPDPLVVRAWNESAMELPKTENYHNAVLLEQLVKEINKLSSFI